MGVLVRLVALLVLFVAGCAAARFGMADFRLGHSPAAALAWSAWHPEAQSREVQRLVGLADADSEAQALALDMLRSSALRGTAYAALGRIADRAGDGAAAESLMRIAARLSPRERGTHAWLADHYVAVGRFPDALEHLDEILRLSPRQAHTIMPALNSLALHPEGLWAVVDLLGSHAPPWRDRFLRGWASSPQDEAMLDELFGALRQAPHPLTSGERDLWVSRLVRQGKVAKAHYLWIEGLPEDQRTQVGNVFDGSFEFAPSDGGFGWRFGRVAGASIRQQGGGGVVGRQALVVEFQHRRVPFQHVQQMLALPSGRYQLMGRVRLDDLRSDRGLQWTVTCIPRPDPLASSQRFAGRMTWTAFSQEFEVPDEGCRAQMLSLRLDARVPAEQWIGGRAWFDDLRIRRVSASQSPPPPTTTAGRAGSTRI